MKALALAVLLFATPIVIDTTKLGEDGKAVWFEGSRRVTVEKFATETIVHVYEGERVDTVILHRDGRITRTDNGKARRFIAIDRPHVIVDGIDLEPFITGGAGERQDDDTILPNPKSRRTGPQYFICPKDETMVRVKPGRAPAELKCPVDGTPMKAGTGRDKQYYLLD